MEILQNCISALGLVTVRIRMPISLQNFRILMYSFLKGSNHFIVNNIWTIQKTRKFTELQNWENFYENMQKTPIMEIQENT